MENKKIIYEDVSTEKYLFEMGQIYPAGRQGQYDFIVGFTPEDNEVGNPYFKVYNHSTKYSAATKVIRISFLSANIVTGHRERNGKREWPLREFSEHTDELMEYLNSPSKSDSNVSVWTELRFQWNLMKGYEIYDKTDYITGAADKRNAREVDYIPYNMKMPDYRNLTTK